MSISQGTIIVGHGRIQIARIGRPSIRAQRHRPGGSVEYLNLATRSLADSFFVMMYEQLDSATDLSLVESDTSCAEKGEEFCMFGRTSSTRGLEAHAQGAFSARVPIRFMERADVNSVL
jgi:hypothetical protein